MHTLNISESMLQDTLDSDEDLFVMNLTLLRERPELWLLDEASRAAMVVEAEILIESIVMTLHR